MEALFCKVSAPSADQLGNEEIRMHFDIRGDGHPASGTDEGIA